MESTEPPPQLSAPRPAASLSLFLVACWLVGIYCVGFSIYLNQPWGLEQLPASYQVGLFAHGLLTMAFFIGALSLPIAVLLRFAQGEGRLRLAVGRALLVIQGIALLGTLLFVSMSYGAYSLTGVFLNPSALVMVTHDPGRLFFHAIAFDPILVGILCGLLLATFALLIVLSRWAARSRAWLRAVSLLTVAALLVTAVGATLTARSARTDETVVTLPASGHIRVADWYRALRTSEAGPFAALLGLYATSEKRPLLRAPALAAGYQSNPLVALSDYAAGVSQADLTDYNVLLILVESLRPDVLTAFGSRLGAMPALDAFATRSQRFARCYAHSSHSNYADTVPLSSQYPLRGWETHYFPENPLYPRVLMHRLLGSVGYRTAIISSQDERWGGMANFFDVDNLDFYFHAENARHTHGQDEPMAAYARWMLRAERSGKVDDRETIDTLIKWMDADSEQPFVAYVNLQSSHYPYWVPEDFDRPFAGAEAKQENRTKARVDSSAIPDALDEEKLHALQADYLNSLAYMDRQLARLFEHMSRQDLWRNTVVVLSADTSTRFLSFASAGKNRGWQAGNASRLFEDVVRVPLLLHVPGQPARDRDEICQHIDVLPTIADAVGLPPHPGFQGVSMLAEAYPRDRPAFMVAQSPLANEYGVIEDNWLLIYDDRIRQFRMGALSAGKEVEADHLRKQKWDRLAPLLSTWITEQIGYYQNPVLQTTHYPPTPPLLP